MTTTTTTTAATFPFPVHYTHHITEQRTRDLLCSALEGGSNYWIERISYRYRLPEGHDLKDYDCHNGHVGKHLPKHLADAGEYHPKYLVIPFIPGCSIGISVLDDDAKGHIQHTLDIACMQRGMQLMAEKYPARFAEFLSENDDAETGDLFLQLSLFGELVYC
jgi:hypothetical protein